MYAYPSALKSEEECIASLQHFVSSTDKISNFYNDNAKELKSAAKKLGRMHELSKAHIHQSNAVAERAVRATIEGTQSSLLQAGLSHVYWPHALEHACTAFNISHPNGIEYIPWKKRFFLPFLASCLAIVGQSAEGMPFWWNLSDRHICSLMYPPHHIGTTLPVLGSTTSTLRSASAWGISGGASGAGLAS